MAKDDLSTVLLVEDEPIVRMATADHIRSQGYTVLESDTADRAIDMIEAGHAIDIIVTDVQMPGTHDGIALALWARRNFPHIKLIIVSGANAGAVEPDVLGKEGLIIPKPYRNEAIVARIGELLGMARLAPMGAANLGIAGTPDQ